jgi:hypothetical protein
LYADINDKVLKSFFDFRTQDPYGVVKGLLRILKKKPEVREMFVSNGTFYDNLCKLMVDTEQESSLELGITILK